MLSIILISVLIIICYYFDVKAYFKSDHYRNYSTTSIPLLKNGFTYAFMSQEGRFTYLRECASKIKKSYRRSLFGITTYNIIKVEDAEKILSSSKHIEKSIIYETLHPFLKTGLLTSGGEKWFTRRRLLTPTFHFNILREFCEIFKEQSQKLVEILESSKGESIDIFPIATQFTLNTICETAMGVKLSDLGESGEKYRKNIFDIGKFIVDRVAKPWLYLKFVYKTFGYEKQFEKLLEPINKFTNAIIRNRRKAFQSKKLESSEMLKDENENVYMSKKKRYAMLDTLLQAQSEGLIDDEGIIEETDTFTFEGHDTTSAGMTFTLLLLAHHQDVQQKLFDEINEVISQSKSENGLGIDEFNKMNYMERVLKESMRIYPPVHFISRAFSEDTKIDEITYKKGSIIEIYIYDIHHDPDVYENPEKFDPDRFLPASCQKRSPFAFLAFSAGMRNCIGQRFAMLELKVMLTEIIKNFIIQPVTKREDLTLIMDLVLRSKEPIKMKFKARR